MTSRERLQRQIEDGFVFFDGGCGSILQAAGLAPGELPETWNILHPEIIRKMHRDYLEAGANIILTNTFGGNCLKYGAEGQFCLNAVVEAAAENARSAVADFEAAHPEKAGRSYVALDIGPLGKLLQPFGDLGFEEAVSIFTKTVEAGRDCGVDLVLVETMNDIYEAKAAVLAVKENCDLPVILTTAYDESEKLLTGAGPETVVAVAEGLGVDAVGVNCSLGPEQMLGIVERLVKSASIPVAVSPNAGIPRSENGKTVYDVTPELFRASMVKIAGLGARLLGGCCGTTPAHIAAMTAAVKDLVPLPVTEKTRTVITSYSRAVEFGVKPRLIGERINPTGKKRFKEALRAHDIDYILQQAVKQQDDGADVLDVNVGLPEIDEPAMMEEVVRELQAVTDLPLQIDTSDPAAMERALRLYNGKAMINSVNGKEEVMASVFPLAKKYGGLLVALTIDENGIPETAEGRLAIAEKICRRAAEYGIKAKDLIFDPLAMSVSADQRSAGVTLESLSLIKERLNGKTSLGVSNISFGLPQRELINASFFVMALERGLDAAIMNPGSAGMMSAYHSFCALKGLDRNFESYIAYAQALPETVVSAPAGKQPTAAAGAASGVPSDELVSAIIKGLRECAGALTEQLLAGGAGPMEIIDGRLIPALDIVGQGYENKTVFLPQLLMSAEAASGSFEVIRRHLESLGGEKQVKGRIVLATVKGDIHDIGKNIVKVLLENYGYEVLDLGKDVDPQRVVDTAKAENIRLVGLSALMTTTVPAMEETIRLLRAELPEAKVVVGGAVLTQEYADMIGADKYAKDAMETVRYAETVFTV